MKRNLVPLNFVAVEIGDDLHIVNSKNDVIANTVQCKSILMAYNSSIVDKAEAIKRAKIEIKNQIKMEREHGAEIMPWKQQSIDDCDTIVGAYQMKHVPNRFKMKVVNILRKWANKIEGTYKGWENELDKLN